MSDRCPFGYLLAHLSRRLIGELIVYPWSGVRRTSSSVVRTSVRPSVQNAQTSSSQKPLGRLKPNFMWEEGTKFCSRHLGHITKMAATPIYGKNPSNIFSSRNGGPIFTKLVVLHRGLQPIIVCSYNDPGLTLTYFTARSNLVTYAFLYEKMKTVDFSETFAASDLKVGRSRHLNEFMKVSEN